MKVLNLLLCCCTVSKQLGAEAQWSTTRGGNIICQSGSQHQFAMLELAIPFWSSQKAFNENVVVKRTIAPKKRESKPIKKTTTNNTQKYEVRAQQENKK